MSLALYTLLMFGCADDGTACEQIAVPQQVYSAAAQCQAQVAPALNGNVAMRADYPLIEARCVKLSKQAAAKPRAVRTFAAR